jgi:hypothetical protein
MIGLGQSPLSCRTSPLEAAGAGAALLSSALPLLHATSAAAAATATTPANSTRVGPDGEADTKTRLPRSRDVNRSAAGGGRPAAVSRTRTDQLGEDRWMHSSTACAGKYTVSARLIRPSDKPFPQPSRRCFSMHYVPSRSATTNPPSASRVTADFDSPIQARTCARGVWHRPGTPLGPRSEQQAENSGAQAAAERPRRLVRAARQQAGEFRGGSADAVRLQDA